MHDIGFRENGQYIPLSGLGDSFVLEFIPDVGTPEDEFVTSTMKVMLKLSNHTFLTAKKRSIDKVFSDAENYTKTGLGSPRYLEVKLSNRSTIHRTEVLGGSLEFLEETLDSDWVGVISTFDMRVKHRPFWEEREEVILPIALHGFFNYQDSVTIQNTRDVGRNNVVWAHYTNIQGDLPAELRIQITNNFATARTGDILLGTHVQNSTHYEQLPLPVIEGENLSAIGNSTVETNSAMSNGQFRQWTNIPTSQTLLGEYTFSQEQVSAFGGKNFQIVLVAAGGMGFDMQLKARLSIEGVHLLEETEWVSVPRPGVPVTMALGSLRLPPYFVRVAQIYPIRFGLYARGMESTIPTLSVDRIHLIPTDFFCWYINKGFGIPNATPLMDEYGRDLYITASGGRMSNYVGIGRPIYLVPSYINSFHFFFKSWTGNAEAARSAIVQFKYRPRRTSPI